MINKYLVRRGIKSTLIHILLISVALTCLFPLLWMFRASFMTNQTVFTDTSIIPQEIHFKNYYVDNHYKIKEVVDMLTIFKEITFYAL